MGLDLTPHRLPASAEALSGAPIRLKFGILNAMMTVTGQCHSEGDHNSNGCGAAAELDMIQPGGLPLACSSEY